MERYFFIHFIPFVDSNAGRRANQGSLVREELGRPLTLEVIRSLHAVTCLGVAYVGHGSDLYCDLLGNMECHAGQVPHGDRQSVSTGLTVFKIYINRAIV